MTDIKDIIAATGDQVNSCSCDKCKDMCRHCPCIGTPIDMLRLIDAGYIDKLEFTYWAAGLNYGIEATRMITPVKLPWGPCAFLTEDGLCELHDKGLKPTEGKLVTHNSKLADNPDKVIPFAVAKSWRPSIHNPNIRIMAIVSEKVAQNIKAKKNKEIYYL
jgi:hypothetical protein